ncbi:MAG: hypothetical protein MK213_03725 [Planctomycetes bacterium]|nr:hypothetical protein [Planctomycetota bacterium]
MESLLPTHCRLSSSGWLSILLLLGALLVGCGQQSAPSPAQDVVGGGSEQVSELAELAIHVEFGPTGEVVPGVEVRLIWKTEEGDVGRDSKPTDGAGNVRFEMTAGTIVESVTVLPTVRSAPASQTIKKPILAGKVVELDFTLEAGGILSGLVLDAEGEPLVGAEIRVWNRKQAELERDPTKKPDLLGRSHEGGVFTIGGLGTGEFIVDAHLPDAVCVLRAGGNVKAGQVLDGFELVLEPAQNIVGRLTGPRQEPVDQGLVVAGMVGRHSWRQPGPVDGTFVLPAMQRVLYSDEHGDFLLENVPTSQVWAVEVKHRDYQPMRTRTLPGQTSIDLLLEAGYRLAGKIVDQESKELPRAYLRLQGEEERERRGQRNGKFQFTGLVEDWEASLYVYVPSFTPKVFWPLRVDHETTAREFPLAQGLVLEGTLLQRNGEPAAGLGIKILEETPARTEAGSESAVFQGRPPLEEFGLGITQTNGEGTFFLGDLPFGRLQLQVTSPNGAVLLETHVTAGEESVTLTLP